MKTLGDLQDRIINATKKFFEQRDLEMNASEIEATQRANNFDTDTKRMYTTGPLTAEQLQTIDPHGMYTEEARNKAKRRKVR